MEVLNLNKKKTVSFSGYRPKKFDFQLMSNEKYGLFINVYMDILCKTIDSGYNNAIIGCAPGFDIISAELIGRIKKNREREINIIGALPYENFSSSKHFNTHWQLRYNSIINDCEYIINTTGKEHETKGCYQKRNEFMINNSSLLVCYHTGKKGGTYNTIEYANFNGVDILNIADFL